MEIFKIKISELPIDPILINSILNTIECNDDTYYINFDKKDNQIGNKLILCFDGSISENIIRQEKEQGMYANPEMLKQSAIVILKNYCNKLENNQYIDWERTEIEYTDDIIYKLYNKGKYELGKINDVINKFTKLQDMYDHTNRLIDIFKICEIEDDLMARSSHILCCKKYNNQSNPTKSTFIPENNNEKLSNILKQKILKNMIVNKKLIENMSIYILDLIPKDFIILTCHDTAYKIVINNAIMQQSLYSHSNNVDSNCISTDYICIDIAKVESHRLIHFYNSHNDTNYIEVYSNSYHNNITSVLTSINNLSNGQEDYMNIKIIYLLSKNYYIYDENYIPNGIENIVKFDDIVESILKDTTNKEFDEISIIQTLNKYFVNLKIHENVVRIKHRRRLRQNVINNNLKKIMKAMYQLKMTDI